MDTYEVINSIPFHFIFFLFLLLIVFSDYPELPYIGIYRLFGEPAILLRSSEMIKEVMIRNFQHFQDNVLWVNPERDPVVTCNPFIAKGEKWRTMRNELVPIFTPNKVGSQREGWNLFIKMTCTINWIVSFDVRDR